MTWLNSLGVIASGLSAAAASAVSYLTVNTHQLLVSPLSAAHVEEEETPVLPAAEEESNPYEGMIISPRNYKWYFQKQGYRLRPDFVNLHLEQNAVHFKKKLMDAVDITGKTNVDHWEAGCKAWDSRIMGSKTLEPWFEHELKRFCYQKFADVGV